MKIQIQVGILLAFCFVSRAGAQGFWQEVTVTSDTLTNPQLYRSPRGSVFVVDGERIYRTRDHGDFWQKIGPPMPQCFAVDSSGIVAVTVCGGIITSTDDGDTWPNAYLNVAGSGTPFEMSRNKIVMRVAGGDLRGSTDSTRTWSSPLTGEPKVSNIFAGIGNNLFVWEGDHGVWIDDSLLPHPVIVESGVYLDVDNIGKLFYHSANGHYFFIASGHLLRSIDNGRNWTEITPMKLLDYYDNTFVEVPKVGFIGLRYNSQTSMQTVLSTDDGNTWTPFTDAPGGATGPMVIDQSGMIFATMFNKVYRSASYAAISPTAPAATGEISGLFLDRNYPNPVESLTTISYRLPESSEATILIRDMLGRTLIEKDLGYQSVGSHIASLDLQGLSNGCYNYTLVACGHSVSRNLLR